MQKIRYVLIALMIGQLLFSQNGREDDIQQLESSLKSAKKVTNRIDIMCELSRTYGGVDSVKCFAIAFEALDLSQKTKYQKGLADSYNAIASGYLDYYHLEKAKEYYKTSNAVANQLIKKDSSEKVLKLWMLGHYNLGITEGFLGNDEQEIAMAERTIPIAEQIGDSTFVAVAMTNLAIKYTNLYRYKKAYETFKSNEKLVQQVGSLDNIIYHNLVFATCLYNMDSLLYMKSTLDKAKKVLDKAPQSIHWGAYFGEMGLYYSSSGQFTNALEALDKSSDFYRDKPTHVYKKLLYQRYTDTYEKMGNYRKAKEYALKSLDFKTEDPTINAKTLAYFKLSEFEAATNNYKAAYNYLKSHINSYDSLRIEKLDENLQKLELKYRTAQAEKEILTLQNEKNEAALSSEKNRSRAYLMAIIIGALGFLLTLGYLFYRKKLRNAKKKQLKQEVEVSLLKQEQQNKIFSAMIDGQEKERKRLAVDLHDGLGGRLSGISIKLSRLSESKEAKPLLPLLDDVLGNLDDSLQELRGVARNLMPETLLKYGLKAAVEDYCSTLSDKETNITLQLYNTEDVTDQNKLLTIYRIIQELINNAIKHANATEILVQCIVNNDKIDITIEDDGKGFDINNRNKNMGLGLTSLKNRVDYLGGIIDIRSEINEGTSITVQIEKHEKGNY